MGLAIQGILKFIDAIQVCRSKVADQPLKVAMLGYQDLWLSPQQVEMILGKDQYSQMSVRYDPYLSTDCGLACVPAKDAEAKLFNPLERRKAGIEEKEYLFYRDHATGKFLYETKSFFKALGCELHVLDTIAHSGMEIMVDLNYPVADDLHNTFDIIVDGGTLEHCFNASQALVSLSLMAKVGGVILHISPLTWPNHGYYNFNPVFFDDFYQSNGFTVARSYGGFNDSAQAYKLPRQEPFELPEKNTLLFFTVLKTKKTEKIVFPAQAVYRSKL